MDSSLQVRILNQNIADSYDCIRNAMILIKRYNVIVPMKQAFGIISIEVVGSNFMIRMEVSNDRSSSKKVRRISESLRPAHGLNAFAAMFPDSESYGIPRSSNSSSAF